MSIVSDRVEWLELTKEEENQSAWQMVELSCRQVENAELGGDVRIYRFVCMGEWKQGL